MNTEHTASVKADEPAELSHLDQAGVEQRDRLYLSRINQLKATVLVQERQVALLSESLSAQHELVQDVFGRVVRLTSGLPDPATLAGTPWQAVAVELLQLSHRLERGLAPRGGASRAPACASRARAAHEGRPRGRGELG